jgi:ferredoxin--NADP+ reductase
MADWVTGKVTKVQFWTDALFSLTVHAPVHPFKPGNLRSWGWMSTATRAARLLLR